MEEDLHSDTKPSPVPSSPVPSSPEPIAPWRERALAFAQRAWRPAGTALAVLLALALTWHVIHGKHGLSVWEHERTQDRALQKEILELQEENAVMARQVDRLKSDPDAIEREAREKLHYAKPGEVIYALPEAPAANK
jgi:cell division protein FtsB